MKTLRIDNGENLSERTRKFLRRKGIRLLNTVSYCSEQNGQVERCHSTVMDAAHTMLTESNMPKHLYAESAFNAV